MFRLIENIEIPGTAQLFIETATPDEFLQFVYMRHDPTQETKSEFQKFQQLTFSELSIKVEDLFQPV